MKFDPYRKALNDRQWFTKREIILERDNYNCVIPNCTNPTGKHLQIHHRQYHFNVQQNKFVDPWDYDDHLLITLCRWCHKKGHKIFKIPIKQIS
jgi:hypothetical protein